MYGHNEDERKAARKQARSALGPRYAQRLAAAYATLIDAEGLLKGYDCRDSELRGVCEAFRAIADDAGLDI